MSESLFHPCVPRCRRTSTRPAPQIISCGLYSPALEPRAAACLNSAALPVAPAQLKTEYPPHAATWAADSHVPHGRERLLLTHPAQTARRHPEPQWPVRYAPASSAASMRPATPHWHVVLGLMHLCRRTRVPAKQARRRCAIVIFAMAHRLSALNRLAAALCRAE